MQSSCLGAGYVVVGGWVDVTTGAAEIQQVYTLDELSADQRRQAAEDSGHREATGSVAPFFLAQVDPAGHVLASQAIALAADDESSDRFFFLEVAPRAAGATATAAGAALAAAVEIHQGEEVRARRAASAQPPTVRLLSPNGGETLHPGAVVTWEAADPDGDELTFDVSYSADGGATWRLLAMGVVGNTWELQSLDALPGTNEGRMRVLANDGYHSVADVSDGAWSVPNSPPLPAIVAPRDGQRVPASERLVLEGMATDAEDGPAYGSLTWSSSLDGALGSGGELVAHLSPGEHRVTLAVTDSAGSRGRDEITVYVVQDTWELYLPVILYGG